MCRVFRGEHAAELASVVRAPYPAHPIGRVETMKQRWPNMRAVVIITGLTWVNTAVGVVIGITTHDLAVILWAGNAAFCAAGWVIACMRWTEYELAAFTMAEELERWRNEPMA